MFVNQLHKHFNADGFLISRSLRSLQLNFRYVINRHCDAKNI